MKRLTLLCVAADKEAALARLAAMGAVHLETVKTEGPGSAAARAAAQAAARALSSANAAAAAAKGGRQPALKAAAPGAASGEPLVSEINALADRCLAAQNTCAALRAEIARHAPFGEFDPAAAARLIAAGVPVALFKAAASCKNPAALSEDGPLRSVRILARTRDGAFGAALGGGAPEGCETLPLPARALSAMKAEMEKANAEIAETAAALARHARDSAAALKARIAACGSREEYWTAFESMGAAPAAGGAPALAHISGFVDARKSAAVLGAAREEGWGAALGDPSEDEEPPVLLEPPRMFRPVTALFAALGITPGYRESDISVPFYIFFSIFFAMLVGDAGYGALIIAATAFAQRRTRPRGSGARPMPVRSAITLFYVFGAATVCYGALSGTYFAIDQKFIPAFLRFKSIAWLADMGNIMRLCLTLGAAHLTIARVWNALSLCPSSKALAEVGWTGVIWSMYLIICSVVIEGFAYPAWGPALFGVSFLLVALFMLKRSELKKDGVLLGMLPLNIISSMGDIISYVRLFAVGLASVKVAENFNSMAVDIALPLWLKVPLMALILLLGHGLNLMMGALSILVHAVRLNTLEFSGAKGVSWSGSPFRPFTARADGDAEV